MYISEIKGSNRAIAAERAYIACSGEIGYVLKVLVKRCYQRSEWKIRSNLEATSARVEGRLVEITAA